MKVKTNYVPKHHAKLLTAGKEYEYHPLGSGLHGGDIYADDGIRMAICLKESDWLDGRDWEIVQ